MISWVAAFVCVTPQLICRKLGVVDINDSNSGTSSPGCWPKYVPANCFPSSRRGVPVSAVRMKRQDHVSRQQDAKTFHRPSVQPGDFPHQYESSPFRKVPVVRMTRGAEIFSSPTTTPATRPFEIRISVTSPRTMSRPRMAATARLAAARYTCRSAWVRSP